MNKKELSGTSIKLKGNQIKMTYLGLIKKHDIYKSGSKYFGVRNNTQVMAASLGELLSLIR